jgi:hypothetical protein
VHRAAPRLHGILARAGLRVVIIRRLVTVLV